MHGPVTFLVFGGTGQTGQHFVRIALEQGHRVRVLARTPGKLRIEHPALEVVQGSIDESLDLDGLLQGVDAVVSMLGDRVAQEHRLVNTELVQRLVPAMRRQGVQRFLYQAGGLSIPPEGGPLMPMPVLRVIRGTIARSYDGQHRDNEAVMRWLTAEASDIEWMVHLAGIGSDGPSKGTLRRDPRKISIGTFVDCADYSLRTVLDDAAVHTCHPSTYRAA